MKCETNRFKNLAAAACVAFAGAAFASVTVENGVATADVAQGETYTLTAADATAILAANSLVKTGAGVLVADSANASLAAFTGEIRVKQGVYRISSAADFGTADGATVVESGACLEAKVTADTNVKTEPFEFAGSGPEDGTGYGSLWLSAGKPFRLGGVVTLAADTSFHVNGNGTLQLNGTVDLASHTLDFWMRGNFATASGTATIKNGGDINLKFLSNSVAALSGIQFGWTHEGTSDRTFTGGGTRGGSSCDPGKTPWTWIVDKPVAWRINAGNGTVTDVPDFVLSFDKHFYGGPVQLNGDIVIGQNRNSGEWQVGGFRGPVSGSGNISMWDATSANKTWFKLGSANPDWTGSISAKRDIDEMTYTAGGATYTTLHHTGIALFADGALTQKTLELKNAELFLGGDDAVQHLPDIVTEGHGRIFGSVTGEVATITKAGTHPLYLETPIAVTKEIVVSEGSLVLPSLADAYAAVTSKYTYAAMNLAGLSETMYIKDADTTNGPTVRAMGPVAGFVDGNNTFVDDDVYAACKSGPGYDDSAYWIKDRGKDLVYQYDGYIWNHASESVTWGFMSCISSQGQIWFENAAGELEIVQTGSYFYSTNGAINAYREVTLKPGANRIRICIIGNGGASAGGSITVDGVSTRPWNKNYALCYDTDLDNVLRKGEWTTTCYEAFDKLLDKEGKGALFTTVSAAEDDLFATYGTEDERTALQAMLPSFAKATFGAGTTLNLNGLPADVPFTLAALEGSPAIVGGNLTVKDWTLAAAAIRAGTAHSAAEGRVTFADGARILIHDSGLAASDEGYALLTAAGGIDGLPELVFLDRPVRAANWKLVLSSDGKTLRLAGGAGFRIIIR